MYEEKDGYKISMPKEIEVELSNLDLSDNNISGRIAHFRDTFITAEREYVIELLKDAEVRKMIQDVNFYKSESIIKKVEEIIFNVENNLIPYEEMYKVEIKLTILLAAIQDKKLIEILELYPEFDEERDFGRTR